MAEHEFKPDQNLFPPTGSDDPFLEPPEDLSKESAKSLEAMSDAASPNPEKNEFHDYTDLSSPKMARRSELFTRRPLSDIRFVAEAFALGRKWHARRDELDGHEQYHQDGSRAPFHVPFHRRSSSRRRVWK